MFVLSAAGAHAADLRWSMKREIPDKRFAKPRGTDAHPWRVKMTATRLEKEAAEKKTVKRGPWACPSCGSPSCDFGECTNSDF